MVSYYLLVMVTQIKSERLLTLLDTLAAKTPQISLSGGGGDQKNRAKKESVLVL